MGTFDMLAPKVETIVQSESGILLSPEPTCCGLHMGAAPGYPIA